MFTRSALPALFVCLAAVSPAWSQNAAPAVRPAPSGTFAVSFEGGTLADYVELIRSRAPDVNIVLDGGAGAVAIPKVSLARVNAPLALHWIQNIAESRKAGLALQTTRVDGDAGKVFVFTVTSPAGARPLPDDKVVKVYSIQSIDDKGPTGDAVRAAVESTISRTGSTAKTAVEFNPANRLVTVTGSRSAIAIADQVIEEMTRGQRLAAAIPRMQLEIDRLKAEVEALKKKP